MQGSVAQKVVDAVNGDILGQGEVQYRQGDVRRRHTDGVARQLALEFRQQFGHRRGGAGFCDHHVQRRTPAPPILLVVVVDQVLVVGVGVHRLHVAVLQPVAVVDRLHHRHDGVGGAGGGAENGVGGHHAARIDPGNDVLEVALGGRGQNHLGGAGAFEVAAEARLVPPSARVVDHDGVVDAVLPIVDRVGLVRIYDPNHVAVGDQAAVLLIHAQRAQEGAVHRIPAQQRRPLHQVAIAGLAHHDGLEPQLVAAAGLLDEQAGKQAADAAKAVQHDVLGLFQRRHMPANHLGAGLADERQRIEGGTLGGFHEAGGQLAHVDVGRPEIEFGQGLQDGVALELRQLVVCHLAHVAMGLHDLDDALVVQRPSVAIGDHVLAVELADDGNHGFGQGFALLPIGEIVFEVR